MTDLQEPSSLPNQSPSQQPSVPAASGPPIPQADRKEVLDLLKDLIAHYTAYHNHKEVMAWAGVVLFSGWVFALATVLKDRVPTRDPFHGTGAVIATVLLGACTVVLYYLRKQFELRKRAADLINTCIWWRSQLISNPSRSIISSKWAPIKLELGASMQSTYALPEAVVTVAEEVASFGQLSRISLEVCAYAIVFGLTVASLFRI